MLLALLSFNQSGGLVNKTGINRIIHQNMPRVDSGSSFELARAPTFIIGFTCAAFPFGLVASFGRLGVFLLRRHSPYVVGESSYEVLEAFGGSRLPRHLARISRLGTPALISRKAALFSSEMTCYI